MITLARFSIRRPKVALTVWLIVAAALSLIGLGVSKTLSPSVTVVPGTQSSRAQELGNASFGPTQLVPILLEGPKTQLDSEGPALVVALRKRPDTRVLSAWDAGTASAGLRPKPTAAMIVVSVDRSEEDAVKYDEPAIENLVAHTITPPVRSYITGEPSIDRAVRDAAISNLRHGELIAVGILFVLLLVGLRAPVAALIVTAVGGISMLAGFGETALLGHVLTLDPVGAALGTMTGLALATAFALLILDRFHREELLPAGGHPRDAATAAVRELQTTGRAVLIGGSGIVLALALSAVIGPTQLMVSLGAGMLTCALFAIGGAVVVMPAAFVLLGRRIDAFSFPAPAPLARAWSGLVSGGNWVTRHAVYAGFAATVLLALLAVPALALKSGQPSPSQLPPSSKARIAFEEVSRVMGPGWATPYNLIVVAKSGPLTTPALLSSVYGFENQIAKNATVYSVTGPGAINPISTQLKSFGPGLKNSVKLSDQSKSDLLKLANGLGRAGAGSAQLQAGLATASSGAGQLHAGGGTAQAGAAQLQTGLAQIHAGSAQLTAGLNAAAAGATELKSGSAQLLSGSTQLANGAKPVVPGLNSLAASAATTSTQVDTALAELNAMTTGKGDAHYSTTLSALTAASSSAAATKALASTVAGKAPALVNGINQLQAGIEKLQQGNAQLADSFPQITAGSSRLTSVLGQATAGAGALEIGLGQLTAGAGQLATGLAGGVAPAGQLTTGLGTMQAAVIKSRGQIPSTAQLKQLFAQSPGMFDSGYFVLSAVEGATFANRNAATFTINLLKGGTAGQIMVVSRYASNDPRTAMLGTTLANMGDAFAKKNNVEIALGGPAGNLGDLTSVTNSRIWINVVVIALALALVLALALRAVLIPIAATIFSLLVTASAFGALQLLYGGSDPPLGGTGYLVPMSIIGIFVIAFSVSMVYSTILLMRSREAYVADGANRAAIRTGLRETAAAATGAGLVMVAALIPFATTGFGFVEPFVVGVSIAILLDVLIMRPVLLPAAEAVLGRYGWWPTRGQRPPESSAPAPVTRRPRLHMPDRRPRAAER